MYLFILFLFFLEEAYKGVRWKWTDYETSGIGVNDMNFLKNQFFKIRLIKILLMLGDGDAYL